VVGTKVPENLFMALKGISTKKRAGRVLHPTRSEKLVSIMLNGLPAEAGLSRHLAADAAK
jgi:hypothetical protein